MSQHTYNWIKDEVNKISYERDIHLDRAFEIFCLLQAHRDLEEDEAAEQSDTLHCRPAGDGKLDGWYRDESQKEFHLWQCKWTNEYPGRYGIEAAEQVKTAATNLLSEQVAAQYGSYFVSVSANLTIAKQNEYTLVLNVGIAGEMNEDAKAQFDEEVRSFSEIYDIAVDWVLWDLERFQFNYEQSHPSSETLSGSQYSLQMQNAQYIELRNDPSLPVGWEALVLSLNAQALGRLANQVGSKLFDLNVRYALGKNKRIKKIRDILRNAEESKYFWFYNNGLTILCDQMEINDEHLKLIVTNPQIVNGCQTVTQFADMIGRYDENPSVLARIIKSPDTERVGRAELIAEYTNSQSPVKASDLRSNDRAQRSLGIKFSQLSPSWFYERKRGQWNTLSLLERNRYKFVGGNRRVTMEYVGQTWRMVKEQPSEALTQKKQLFEEEDIYNSVFSGNRDPVNYIFAVRLRKKYEEFWHGKNFERIKVIAGEEEIDDSVLKRFMRAKGQIVSHSVALASRALKRDREWSREDSVVGNDLIDSFGEKFREFNAFLVYAFIEFMKHVDADPEITSLKKGLEKRDRYAFERLLGEMKRYSRIGRYSNLREVLIPPE